MDCIIKGGKVYIDGKFVQKDFAVLNGTISFSNIETLRNIQVFDFTNKFIFPGFVDVHTHLREPGFSYKETILTGTKAGARSGYSSIFAMPNLNPVPDSVENLNVQLELIKKDAVINVYPYASITVGQKGEKLADLDNLANKVIAFSDDGKGVQSQDLMLSAMKKAKLYDKIIVAHCEDESLLNGGYIHDGEYAKLHGHKGICSESEYLPIKRDLELVNKTGAKYHVCHLSAKESVNLINDAKAKGLNVTAETAPHYLIFSDSDLCESGVFKMNPPIRSIEDKNALIKGIKDGTIDMIATDHAPHSQEEKSKGLLSVNGIVGLETAFPILYTYLVERDIITFEKLIELMSVNPSKRFNLDCGIADGKVANFCVFDLGKEYIIDSRKFLSKGKSTPFDNFKVKGECVLNVVNGKNVWQQN